MGREDSRYIFLNMHRIGVIVSTGPSLPLSGVRGTSAGRPTVRVVTKPPALAVRKVVYLMRPRLPILVMVDKLPHLAVPLLHPTSFEVFIQKTSRPENTGVESIQLFTRTTCVEPTEFPRLWTIIVCGVFLNILEFKQLYILVYKQVA